MCVFIGGARVETDACASRLLGLLETLAWRSQEGALGGRQGSVGFSYQVRMGAHHGLPAGSLHHLGSMTAGQNTHGVRSGCTGSHSKNLQNIWFIFRIKATFNMKYWDDTG